MTIPIYYKALFSTSIGVFQSNAIVRFHLRLCKAHLRGFRLRLYASDRRSRDKVAFAPNASA